MSDKKEPWEYIAGELLPGWLVRPQGRHLGWEVLSNSGDVIGVAPGEGREYAHRWAWDWIALHTGITRRKHAERIAPERVREVAAEAVDTYAVDGMDVNMASDGCAGFRLHSFSSQPWVGVWFSGHDICTAAWRAMLAITEGLPEGERAELLRVSVDDLRAALEVE